MKFLQDNIQETKAAFIFFELISAHGQKESNIFYKYKQIKQRNELLKSSTYTQFWKQLKLPATEDSQAKEVAETEGHKEEILKLIMEQNAQIREMEEEMDKSIKEKEQSVQMAIIPLETIPLIGDQKNARGS